MGKRFLLMLLIAGAIFGGLGYAKYQQIMALKARFSVPQPPTPVEVATVARVQRALSIPGTGTLTAVQDIFVTNEVPGIVSTLSFESGARVAAGDVLVTLDASVDEATLEGMVADLELARVQRARAEKLVARHTISQSDYDEILARETQAGAAVASHRALIAKKTIRAPFAGTLGIRRIDVGDYLAAGSPIVPLQTLDPLYLDSAIPEKYIAALKPGQTVRVKAQAYGAEVFEGQISAVEPGADPATRMVRVRAELPNADHRLRPGMFVEVELLEEAAEEVLELPDTAITYSPYGNSVFILLTDKDGALSVERRQVETRAPREGRVVVEKGLAEGDRVVATGQNKLRNGVKVVVSKDAPLVPVTSR